MESINVRAYVIWVFILLVVYKVSCECDGLKSLNEDPCVTLTSTSPVTLDTPIWFTATLQNYKLDDGDEILFNFSDGLFSFEEIQINHTKYTWSVNFLKSKYKRFTGKRTATVTVKKKPFLFWISIDKAYHTYKITENLSGGITIKQGNLTSLEANHFIPTSNHTNLTAVVHDPHSYIKNLTLDVEFYWIIDQQNIGSCMTPSVITNITLPGRYLIEMNVVVAISDNVQTTLPPNFIAVTSPLPTLAFAVNNQKVLQSRSNDTASSNIIIANVARSKRSLLYDGKNKTTTTSTTTTTTTKKPPTPPTPPPPTPTPDKYKCDGVWPGGSYQSVIDKSMSKQPRLYAAANSSSIDKDRIYLIGIFSRTVIAKDIIKKVNVSGSTWLKQEEMVNITVQCDGTGEWTYCWEYKDGVYNVTGKETCDDPTYLYNKCEFNIEWFLQFGKTYKFVITIDNGVSHTVTPLGINKYDKQPKSQLLLILIPVFMSCVVFVIVVLGVSFFISNRRNHIVEVADFDFAESTADAEDAVSGLSLFSHLKYSIRQALGPLEEERRYRRMPQYVEQPSILDDETE